MLNRLIIRKDPLYTLVEFLGKCIQVLGGVELRPFQFSWLWVE